MALEEIAESNMVQNLLFNASMMENAKEICLNVLALEYVPQDILCARIVVAYKALEKLISVIAYKTAQGFCQMDHKLTL